MTNQMIELSSNPLVRAKQEAQLAVQELITKDEAKAKHLENIAQQLAEGHAAFQDVKDRTSLEEGRLVAEAYAELGDGLAFSAWWDRPETWIACGNTKPFHVVYAKQLKRLHDFCSGAMVGKGVGRPKNPEGFTTEALVELVAPKYLKDSKGDEFRQGGTIRTDESQIRLDVIEEVYGTLKNRAYKRGAAADKLGKSPAPITKKDVVAAIREAFQSRQMPVQFKTVPRRSLMKVLQEVEERLLDWEDIYGLAGRRVIKDKIEEILSTWEV